MGSVQKRIITVEHLARVEGRGLIEIHRNGDEIKAQVRLVEGPRFFEYITRNKPYDVAVDMYSRICAICSASHKITPILATEKAFGIEVGPITQMLRKLLIYASFIESHSLHVFLLALPDFLGYPDAISMADKYGSEVSAGLMMKKTANFIQALIGGREIHQENAIVGGFGKIPTKDELYDAYERLKAVRNTAKVAIDILASLSMPPYLDGEYVHVALKQEKVYDAFGDTVASTGGIEFPVDEYRNYLVEESVSHSFAKFAYLEGKEFMVGALSRLALNGDKLRGEAKEIYSDLLDSGALRWNNAFYNNIAQAVELLYFVDASMDIIARLLDMPLENDRVEVKPRAGRGAAITEAPRGIISYTIEYDDSGNVVFADLVTPTAYNFATMYRDVQKMAEGVLAEKPTISDEELTKYVEMVPRAYDPCISCSVHIIGEDRA